VIAATAALQPGSSIRATARWAAALNLLSAVPDGYSVTVLQKMVVRGNAAATAANVLGAEATFRLGFVADLFGLLLFLGSGLLLYEVFQPASRRAARLYLALFVMGVLSQALESVQDLTALALLKGGAGMTGLPPASANALAFLFLHMHSFTYELALFFFSFTSLVMAWLVLRSTFVPRIFALLMLLDGLGGLTFTLASFLSPPLATRIFPLVPFATVAAGEGVLYLWLLVKSVHAERWHGQAAASRAAYAGP